MTKPEINTRLGELLQLDPTPAMVAESKQLLASYQTSIVAEHKAQLENFLAEGGERKNFEPQRNEDDITFDTLWTKFAQKIKAWEKEQAEVKERSRETKQQIITSIQELVNEEHIGKAMTRMRELQDAWKEAGQVAGPDDAELQNEFSRVRDEFYYNMRIYRELLEHDLKRNLQLKEELAEKMEALQHSEDQKEIEGLVKVYTSEWDEIGPTFREKWEEVRDRFRTAQRAVYDRIHKHYQTVRDRQTENLERKQALCEKIEKMLEHEIQTEKRWRRLTDDVKKAQQEWKTIGFVPKKDNEAIWERFKAAGDEFFQRKSAFYKGLKEKQDHYRDLKKELVTQAEALQESQDWKQTSDTLIELQKRWKQIGPAHQRDEQRLWKQFRAACNAFFEHKKTFFSTKDERQSSNLKAKEAAITAIEQFKPGEHRGHNLLHLDALVTAFHEVGFVPIDKKAGISQDYRKALRDQYKALSLTEDELRQILYYQKLRELFHGEGDRDALKREERNLRDKMRKLESTITQYENNLGFFGQSKGAEKLREQAEEQLRSTREQHNDLDVKLQQLYRAFEQEPLNPLVSKEDYTSFEAAPPVETPTPEAEPAPETKPAAQEPQAASEENAPQKTPDPPEETASPEATESNGSEVTEEASPEPEKAPETTDSEPTAENVSSRPASENSDAQPTETSAAQPQEDSDSTKE